MVDIERRRDVAGSGDVADGVDWRREGGGLLMPEVGREDDGDMPPLRMAE